MSAFITLLEYKTRTANFVREKIIKLSIFDSVQFAAWLGLWLLLLWVITKSHPTLLASKNILLRRLLTTSYFVGIAQCFVIIYILKRYRLKLSCNSPRSIDLVPTSLPCRTAMPLHFCEVRFFLQNEKWNKILVNCQM